GREERSAFLQDVGSRPELDGCAHADVEHGEDGQRAGEERPGKRAEEGGSTRCESADDGAEEERDDHHPARYALDRALDGELHGRPPCDGPRTDCGSSGKIATAAGTGT